MDRHNLEPLHPEVWLASFRSFRQSLQRSNKLDYAKDIRRLFHILRLAPAPLRPLFVPGISEKLFEQMLEECEILASLSLINHALDVTFHRHSDHPDVKITLTFPGAAETVKAEHHSLPVAVMHGMSALALTLITQH